MISILQFRSSKKESMGVQIFIKPGANIKKDLEILTLTTGLVRFLFIHVYTYIGHYIPTTSSTSKRRVHNLYKAQQSISCVNN